MQPSSSLFKFLDDSFDKNKIRAKFLSVNTTLRGRIEKVGIQLRVFFNLASPTAYTSKERDRKTG
jgi:hypothetical protein